MTVLSDRKPVVGDVVVGATSPHWSYVNGQAPAGNPGVVISSGHGPATDLRTAFNAHLLLSDPRERG
jgi:hypothetical protein